MAHTIKPYALSLLLLLLFSCKQFDGQISEGSIYGTQSVILTNTSKYKKIQFTIKKHCKTDDGKKNSFIAFYTLEPGAETRIGETISYSPIEYYSKIVNDTIKEYTHFDKVIKYSKSFIDFFKKIPAFKKDKYYYLQTYTKNGAKLSEEEQLSPFWHSDWKAIDTAKNNSIQVITYLDSHVAKDLTKPKKRTKFIYSYEIKGQRIIN